MQKSHRLNRRIEEFQSQSLMAQTLAQAKESIWEDISQSITEVWPSIQIIFKREELINRCQVVIDEVNLQTK